LAIQIKLESFNKKVSISQISFFRFGRPEGGGT
jgi:hypothetical protein